MTATPTVSYVSTGIETQFPVPFPYLDAAHVKLYVNGVALGSAHLATPVLATISGPYVRGTRITLARETPEDPLVVLQTGPLKSTDINRAVLQSLYLVQEQQAILARTLRTLPGYDILPLPINFPGSIPEFDDAGNPHPLPTEDLIQELLRRGVFGDGQIWPATGGDYVAPAPGSTLTLPFEVQEAWLFPMMRNGVPQRPGVDYTISPTDLTTINVVTPFLTGERFWGFRAGGLQAQVLARGITSPEANWVRTDGSDWSAAFQRALGTGKRVVGDPTVTYGITVPLALPNFTDLRDCTFRDDAPQATGHATRKLLYYQGTGRCRLMDVHVDRNGDGTGGSLDTAAAIWCEGGRIEIERVEVTGGNKGAGIKVNLCASGFLKDSRVHDLWAGTAGGSQFPNDVINGIALTGTPGFAARDNTVEDILTRWTAHPLGIQRQTRGIAIGGQGATTMGLVVSGNTVRRADQGLDCTGDEVPTKISITDNYFQECALFGIKVVLTSSDVLVANNHIHRTGFAGIELAGGGVPDGTFSTTYQALGDAANSHNVHVHHNQITDQGYLMTLSGQISSYGIKLEDNSAGPLDPKNICIEDNDVDGYVDGSSYQWMDFGVVNQQRSVAYGYFPRQKNNRVGNARQYDVQGFLTGRSELAATAGQSVANTGARTIIAWDQISSKDDLQLLSTTFGTVGSFTPTTALTARAKARILFTVHCEFTHDPTGDRTIELAVNGSFSDFHRYNGVATSNDNDDCNLPLTAVLDLNPGDVVTFGVSMRAATGAVSATCRLWAYDMSNSDGVRVS